MPPPGGSLGNEFKGAEGLGSLGLQGLVGRSQAQDGRQDVVHVVGDAAGQAAQAVHLLGMLQLSLQLGLLPFGLAAFADIQDEPADADGVPLPPDRGRIGHGVERRAVLADRLEFQEAADQPLHALTGARQHPVAVLRGDVLAQVDALPKPLRGESIFLDPMLVGVGQQAVDVGLEDRLREQLGQLPEALLAGPQGLLGLHVPGDLPFQLLIGPLQLSVGLGKLEGAFGDLGFQELVALLQPLQGIDLPFADQMVGDGNTAVGDFPSGRLEMEDQHQPGRLLGQDVVAKRQVDVEESGRYRHRVGQGLDGQVREFDPERVGHLGEILAGDGHPFIPAVNEVVAAPGEAGEIFAEMPSQSVIPG